MAREKATLILFRAFLFAIFSFFLIFSTPQSNFLGVTMVSLVAAPRGSLRGFSRTLGVPPMRGSLLVAPWVREGRGGGPQRRFTLLGVLMQNLTDRGPSRAF